MAEKGSKKRRIKDVDWFKRVLKWKKVSIRSLGKERGGVVWTERTIRQSLQDDEISPGLLDAIAKKLDVHPNYLVGEYSWTLDLPVMDEPGVRDNWIEHSLNPENYPYILLEQERLGSYRHLKNTLLIHDISEEDFKALDAKERHRVEFYLDRKTTELLRHWFPKAEFFDREDHYLAMEWGSDNPNDVYEALLPYLVERGLAEEDVTDWDDHDSFAEKYHIDE